MPKALTSALSAFEHEDELGDVLDFLRLIWAVDHALHRASKRTQALLGVTGPQRFLLRIVGRFPSISAGHLAKLLHVHPSTLTGVLKRLEREGLLRRRADPRDARRVLLGLTERGRRFDTEAEGTVEAAIRDVLSSARGVEIAHARSVLTQVAGRLQQGTARGSDGLVERERGDAHRRQQKLRTRP